MLAALNTLAAELLAGIAFDNQIRGWLVVIVGAAVLGGSVWLILATNVGVRLSTLVSLAGLFGWMVIMGFIWWIYGIGRAGSPPTWEIVDFVTSQEALANSVVEPADVLAEATTTTSAAQLVDDYCPGLKGAFEEVLSARAVAAADDNLDNDDIPFTPPGGLPEYCNEELAEQVGVPATAVELRLTAANDALPDDDPRKLDADGLAARIAEEVDDETRKKAALYLSALDSVAPDLVNDAEADGVLEFQGWRLIPNSEAGEAQAAASAFLVDTEDTLDTGFGSAADFVTVNTFEKGGKELRTEDEEGVWDRVWHEIKESATIFNPTRYAVVEVQRTIQKEQAPGEAPPFPEGDPDYATNYVIMVRDLGDRRLPSFIVMVGSGLVFAGLCWMLHRREAVLRENFAAAGIR
jgi:hypothetical protein